jgi:hypothetical protein
MASDGELLVLLCYAYVSVIDILITTMPRKRPYYIILMHLFYRPPIDSQTHAVHNAHPLERRVEYREAPMGLQFGLTELTHATN